MAEVFILDEAPSIIGRVELTWRIADLLQAYIGCLAQSSDGFLPSHLAGCCPLALFRLIYPPPPQTKAQNTPTCSYLNTFDLRQACLLAADL